MKRERKDAQDDIVASVLEIGADRFGRERQVAVRVSITPFGVPVEPGRVDERREVGVDIVATNGPPRCGLVMRVMKRASRRVTFDHRGGALSANELICVFGLRLRD